MITGKIIIGYDRYEYQKKKEHRQRDIEYLGRIFNVHEVHSDSIKQHRLSIRNDRNSNLRICIDGNKVKKSSVFLGEAKPPYPDAMALVIPFAIDGDFK